MFADLDVDLVELAPFVPAPAQARLREVRFRVNAWLPQEDSDLRRLFIADQPIAEIADTIGRTFQATRTRVWELGLRRNSKLPWTELEDAELARRYGYEPAATIAGDLGRPVASTYARACVLGLTEKQAPFYSDWEDAQIRAGYERAIPVGQIATLIGRTLSGVATRASTLKLRHPSMPTDWSDSEVQRMLELAQTGMLYSRIRRQMIAEGFPPRSKQGFGQKLRIIGYGRGWGRPWTPDEDEMIRRAYAASESLTPLVQGLGRTRTSICWRARALGVAGTHKNKAGFRQGPVWSAEDNALLREQYGKVPMQELADRLGRKLRAMYVHAHHLGLSANYNRRFSPDEDRQIREALEKGGDLRGLCQPLNRNIDSIQRRIKKLGLAERRP
ncbi:MAG: hypothetical protein AB7O91_03920 [Sphingomonas sp.]